MSSRARSASGRRAELRAAATLAAAALASGGLVAGCGGGSPEPGAETAVAATTPSAQEAQDAAEAIESGEVVDIAGTEPVGEMTAGSVASLVECRDWNAADEGERTATIEDVRSQINLEDSGIEAPALTDEEAGELFDGACERSWAAGFRLYKIYARGAGFVELKRMLEAGE